MVTKALTVTKPSSKLVAVAKQGAKVVSALAKAGIKPKANPVVTVQSAIHKFEQEMYNRLNKNIGKVLRDNGIAAGTYANKRMSTNLLSVDLSLGGGIRPGCWYTSLGKEQSAKSTFMTQCMVAGVLNKVPFNHFWDYEGSTGTDEVYLGNQFKANGIALPYDEILGAPEDGLPVSYWSEDILEAFFENESSILRRIPDKMLLNGSWWLMFPDNAYGKEMTQGKHDKDIKKQYSMLAVPCLDGSMQGLICLDSYPAMNPRAQDEDDKPGAGMAIQARCFADNVKKIKGKLKAKGFTLMGVNQLRLRPGFTMGCFHGSAKVTMANGTEMFIQDIIDQRHEGPVLSFNPTTKVFESKKIVNWYDNGEATSYLQFKCTRATTANSLAYFKCTPNHLLMDAQGVMRQAHTFGAGQELKSACYKKELTSDQKQLILGMVLGDGWFLPKQQSERVAFAFAHKTNHNSYTTWLARCLKSHVSSDYTSGDGSMRTVELGVLTEPWFETVYAEAKKGVKGRAYRLSPELLGSIGALGLAVWFMDDASKNRGRIKMQSYKLSDVQAFADTLNNRLDIDLKVQTWKDASARKGSGWGVQFGPKALSLIAPYVRKSMAGICLKDYAVDTMLKTLHVKPSTFGAQTVTVLSVAETQANSSANSNTGRVFRNRKFDIEVQDNHLYCVSGVVVHNSPEYEPCGEALKFVSDCRMRWSAQSANNYGGKGDVVVEESIYGGSDSYKYIKYKLIKNKIGKPYLEGLIRVHTSDPNGEGHGIDHVLDAHEFLKSTGQIKGTKNKMSILLPGFEKAKSVNWLQFKTLVLGKGEQKLKVYRDIGACKKGEKPKSLRAICFSQIREGSAIVKYNAQLKLKPVAEEPKGGY